MNEGIRTRRLHGNGTNSRRRRHGFRRHHSSAVGSCSPSAGGDFPLSFFFLELDPVSTLTRARSISVPERHTPLECLHAADNLIRQI